MSSGLASSRCGVKEVSLPSALSNTILADKFQIRGKVTAKYISRCLTGVIKCRCCSERPLSPVFIISCCCCCYVLNEYFARFCVVLYFFTTCRPLSKRLIWGVPLVLCRRGVSWVISIDFVGEHGVCGKRVPNAVALFFVLIKTWQMTVNACMSRESFLAWRSMFSCMIDTSRCEWR